VRANGACVFDVRVDGVVGRHWIRNILVDHGCIFSCFASICTNCAIFFARVSAFFAV
jgi:hypothetical protein